MSKTIVFFGSGDVAARSLELLAKNFDIEAVVTKPQPPHHKEVFPVIATADKLGLKLFFATDKKQLSKLFSSRPVKSDVAVLVDFGIIVSQDVIEYFPLGIVNSHFSLLPQWRGADPITFSILSGQEKTGVSLMLLNPGLDEGDIIAAKEYKLDNSISTPKLTDSLILLSDSLLQNALPAYVDGVIKPTSQEQVAKALEISPVPTYSRKLTKEDGIIDWNKPAQQIEREIRAYQNWPKSRTKLGDIDVVITASVVDSDKIEKPGTIIITNNRLIVACGTQSLEITSLKPAGKNEMSAKAFLAGYSSRIN